MTPFVPSTQQFYNRMRSELRKDPRNAYPILSQLALGLGITENVTVAEMVVAKIARTPHEHIAAERVFKIFEKTGAKFGPVLAHRAQKIAREQLFPVLSHLSSESVILDFGCGDGEVAFELQQMLGCRIVLYDVYDGRTHRVRNSGMPFALQRDMLTRPCGTKYDAIVACTVLHHCDFPLAELQLISTLTNHAVIIESIVSPLVSWLAQAVADWTYNRGLHPGHDINVPGKFQEQLGWMRDCNEVGFDSVNIADYEIDFPELVPEHHMRFDARRVHGR